MNNEIKEDKNYLTPKDLEEKLQLSHNTVNKLINLEGFPAIRIGRSIRIRPEALEEFMKNYESKTINL